MAPPHAEVPALLDAWERAYAVSSSSAERLIAAMCSHHRLAWIHPFEDGNGRVVRLHTNLVLDVLGLTRGIWTPVGSVGDSNTPKFTNDLRTLFQVFGRFLGSVGVRWCNPDSLQCDSHVGRCSASSRELLVTHESMGDCHEYLQTPITGGFMLPSFSEANINAYLASIGSSVSDINQFYADLSSNWLGAFQSRFTLTQANVDLLNNFPGDGKEAILEAMALCSRWASRPDIDLPIDMSIIGFAAPLSQPAEIPLKFKLKIEGGTYYDGNGDLKFKVKKATVEATFTVC